MVAILAFIALVIVLSIDIWRRRGADRSESGLEARSEKLHIARGIAERYFHPSHSWALVHRPRLVSVGVDDFAARFVGRIDAIEIGKPGTRVQQGDPLVTLKRGRRSLTLMAPLSGVLMDVNSRLLSQPALVNESPYDQGWIAKLSPSNLEVDMHRLVTGPMAQRWRQSAQEKLVLWFAPKLGTALPDGGQLSETLGDLISDEDWEMLVKILFPLQPASKPFNPTNGHGVRS